MKVTQHTCPGDCFDACAIQAFVNDNGRLVKVAGDKKHTYTNGKLCCKGYAYTEYVYHPDRIIYPTIQKVDTPLLNLFLVDISKLVLIPFNAGMVIFRKTDPSNTINCSL